MSSGLIQLIKQVAMDAMDNNQMCDLRFGKVVSTNPLKVRVTNQFTIPEDLLIVPEHLTDYEKEVSFSWNTETDGGNHSHMHSDAPSLSPLVTVQTEATKHNHQIKSDRDSPNKKIRIHCALKKGEKVALLRKQGGQSYYILDRV